MHVKARLVIPGYDSEMPRDDSGEWARICRIEAAWTSHPSTRELLLTLAAEFEELMSAANTGEGSGDRQAQEAFANRVLALAARRAGAQKP